MAGYGPAEMSRAHEIVALRALGFSLAQVARGLAGDSRGLEPALAAHQAALDDRLHQLVGTIQTIGSLRDNLTRGEAPTVGELARLKAEGSDLTVAFDLPYPWGGERFELGRIRPLNYIIGPLGSGKTRLAQRLAETLPNALFLGLDRSVKSHPALKSRVARTLAWLVEDGAAHRAPGRSSC